MKSSPKSPLADSIVQGLLPAPAREIVSYEVDTEADLVRAREFARSLLPHR